MIKTILVPLDGSPAAETVLPYVELIASRTGADVKLLTVGDDAEAVDYLNDVAAELKSRSLTCSAQVAPGGEAETIVEHADALDAGLTAMSTHGRSGVMRWVLGSVASKVLHGIDKPLLLVRASDDGPAPPAAIGRIVVPLDGSKESLGVLPFVEDLAAALEADLVLYNGVPPMDIYPGTETSSGRVGDLMDELQKQGREFLAKVASEIEARGKTKAQTVVTVGFPVGEIVRVAQDVDAGLVAMATHGRSGVDRWVMGSVADGVVRRSSLPCLLLRPETNPGS